MGAKRRFGREFKIEAVKRVLGSRRATEVAEELGISAEALRRWKRDFATGGERAFPGHGRPKPENEELVALRRENALAGGARFPKGSRGVTASMSRRGTCDDNAPSKSFVSSFKTEWVPKGGFVGKNLARAAIFEYIEILYNRRQRHRALGGVTSARYEASRGEQAARCTSSGLAPRRGLTL